MENKNNRYSIRKFSVGVGSILIASFIMIFQNEAHASEKAIETPKEEKAIETLKEEKAIETPKEEKAIETLKEEKAIETPKEEKAIETLKEEKAIETPKEEKAIETPKEEKAIETPKEEKAIETPKEEKAIETPKEEKAIETPKEKKAIETPKEKKAIETPKEEKAIETPKEEKAIETPKNSNDLKFLKDAKFSSDSENLDIRLRPEYNVGNALVVRVDKEINPEKFVDYPEGYTVQSYVSKGSDYPSVEKIVKNKITGMYKITYTLMDKAGNPVNGSDGQVVIRSLNIYFYDPTPVLESIDKVNKKIKDGNYSNGDEVKKELDKIRVDIERPKEIPNIKEFLSKVDMEEKKLKVTDTTAPEAPSVNDTEVGSKKVSGKGHEVGNTVTVTFPDGKTATSKVDEKGNWTVDVPEGTELKVGNEITATETDMSGNKSESGKGKVTDTTAPEAPSVNDTEVGSKKVSGKGHEVGNTVTVTFPDGKTATSKVDEKGNWTVDVPEGTELKVGNEITATETDMSGNKSESGKGKVTDTTAPEAPSVNDTEVGSKKVSGKGHEVGNTVTVTFPDGKTATSKVDEKGNWTVDVPEGTELKVGNEITATETDMSGNKSESGKGKVTDTTAPEAPSVNDTEVGSKKVSGKGHEVGNTVTVTFPDGKTATSKVDEKGNWTVDVPEGTELKVGNEITATETDMSGNKSESGKGKVTDTTAPEAPSVNDTEVGSKKVSGKGHEVGNTVTVTFPDGKTATSKVDEKGNNYKNEKLLPNTGMKQEGKNTAFSSIIIILMASMLFINKRRKKENKEI
ncbi:Ig-like domain-containing protein [Staphylococcus aureus]|uniref:Ig-like domain-containing protein n=1 Tax=Staphylococcus aureus TaxID=1280 RepID=UPI001652D2F9|nr:Ig-like domain-containing protein [Staphylococcus aureus]